MLAMYEIQRKPSPFVLLSEKDQVQPKTMYSIVNWQASIYVLSFVACAARYECQKNHAAGNSPIASKQPLSAWTSQPSCKLKKQVSQWCKLSALTIVFIRPTRWLSPSCSECLLSDMCSKQSLCALHQYSAWNACQLTSMRYTMVAMFMWGVM